MIDPVVVHVSTLLFTFAIFVGILVWAFGRKRTKAFEEAALLPFQEDDEPARHPNTGAR
jgi:cytochrome c oxidase cbb3-type subunit IV